MVDSPEVAVQQRVSAFTGAIAQCLDSDQLDGPVRLDPTRTVVMIDVKNRGTIHVHVHGQIDENGAREVVHKLGLVPSLKGLVKES